MANPDEINIDADDSSDGGEDNNENADPDDVQVRLLGFPRSHSKQAAYLTPNLDNVLGGSSGYTNKGVRRLEE